MMYIFPRKPIMVAAATVIGLLALAAGYAESQAAARLEFEVASVKPDPPSDAPRVSSVASMTDEHGRIDYSHVTVRALIRKAYAPRKVYPLAVGSDPLATERYHVVAKASGDVSDEQTMQMLRTLLEDRFRLKTHFETKDLPMYALIAGNAAKSAKLREVKNDGTAPEITGGGESHPLKAHHATMKMLAGTLQGYIGNPVQDLTGLTGLYDFSLAFSSDENISANPAFPSVFTAVQEQLGLRLEARKGPVETIVIDHVEKPSEN